MRKPALFLNFVIRAHGSHAGGWRYTNTHPTALTGIEYYLNLVKTAERGLFDTVFLTDTLSLSQDPIEALQWPLDPVVLMAALATHTSHIGLIATHSTTFNSPFNTARMFASLDHLSGGRAGWNVVTSTGDATAQNFGVDTIMEHDARYRQAAEYLDATISLWHSWDKNAVNGDKSTGGLINKNAVHDANFKGEYYAVRGPLNTPSSPQIVPILSQAGSSSSGRDLAARYGDIIYAFHSGLADSKAYRDDLRLRAKAYGRDPDSLRLLPGIVPYVGSTEHEAKELRNALFELDDPKGQIEKAGTLFGLELSVSDLDKPVNWQQIEQRQAHWGDTARVTKLLDAARVNKDKQTLRDLILGLDFRFQHKSLIGTPDQIADYIEQGYTTGAFDGVSIIPPVLPEGIDAFVDLVVPVLQKRGIHKTSYPDGPLRQRLGLREWEVDRSKFTPHYK